MPFERQVRIVMDHLKKLVEAAGSNMDCLLKVIVWLKDQRQQEEFDRIYRSYFTSTETLPARTRMQAGPHADRLRPGGRGDRLRAMIGWTTMLRRLALVAIAAAMLTSAARLGARRKPPGPIARSSSSSMSRPAAAST